MTIRALIILVSVALGAMRLAGVKDPAFQAIAHVFIGVLLGLLARRDFRWLCVACGAALSAVELAAAFVL